MVTRKPLPANAMLDPAASQAQQARMQDVRQQLRTTVESDDDDDWGNSPPRQDRTNLAPEDVPAPLRPGSATNYAGLEDDNVWADAGPRAGEGRNSGEVNRVPTVLRPGAGGRVKATEAAPENTDGKEFTRVPTVLRPGGGRIETNPFKRMMSTSQEELQAPTAAPPPVPIGAFSQLSVSEPSTNPWQPALGSTNAPAPPPLVSRGSDQERDTVWDSAKPSRQTTPCPTSNPPALLSLPSDEGSAGWDEESRKGSAPAPLLPPATDEVLEDSHAWDDLGTIDKGKGPARPPIPNAVSSGAGDDWNLIDVDAPPPPPISKQTTWDNFVDAEEGVTNRTPNAASQQRPEGVPPELPPRRSVENPPPQPPRPVDKSETYQIKKITWHDVTAVKNPRTSPILVQNANGPCPLVALVNALSLTTPADKTNTALVETLRSREQVSIGLLLDAVFEELMSERRTHPDIALPDITELYDFLKGLHTGMNVNPRFIPTHDMVTAFKRTSLTHLHPTERGDLMPGTFENTKEMALYATFSIPLIHGWVPSKDDAVYDSFVRQAVSYEDAQNLLFREEELEDKLSNSHHVGLTEEEQQIYQDILTIKSFLSISATQLTPWGLEVIKKTMKPGTVAILFRNDHFSTLYKHPQTQELLTLVTDAGYAGHAEVVWESLVDVNGERAEFFSGDFRLVGGASHEQQQPRGRPSSPVGNNSGWTTVQPRRGRNSSPQRTNSDEPPLSPVHEQEDRDLALALQLQEEEDERHRVEQARRKRESQLSEQFIEQQARTTPNSARGGRGGQQGAANGRGGGTGRGGSQTSLQSAPTPAARRSSTTTTIPVTTSNTPPAAPRPRPVVQTVRSLIPPRTNRPADEGLDDAPPSYEQAAKQTPYVPPVGHPNHPASAPGPDGAPTPVTPGPSTSGRIQPSGPPSPLINRASRQQGQSPGYPGVGAAQARPRPGMQPPMVTGQGQAQGGKDKGDCVVM